MARSERGHILVVDDDTMARSALATLRVERALTGASDLRAVRIAGPTLERTTAIFWNRNGYRSAAARAVAALITSAYASHAGKRSPRKAAASA